MDNGMRDRRKMGSEDLAEYFDCNLRLVKKFTF